MNLSEILNFQLFLSKQAVFKKGEKECKNNHRSVSIWSKYQKYLKDIFLEKYQTI